MPSIRFRFALLFAILPLLNPVQATEQTPRYDQVNLSATASRETDNDTLIAVLSAQREGEDPAALSDSVNRLIDQAVAQARQLPEIKVQTLGYQTSPIYRQQRLVGWRVKQSLRLESRDGESLSQLLSGLQATLALQSIGYAVSDERRREVEEALIKQALDSFQQRAQLITHHLGRQSYRLVEMSIHDSDQQLQPMSMRASMMTTEGAVAAPRLEAGTQTLKVEINGRIELQLE